MFGFYLICFYFCEYVMNTYIFFIYLLQVFYMTEYSHIFTDFDEVHIYHHHYYHHLVFSLSRWGWLLTLLKIENASQRKRLRFVTSFWLDFNSPHLMLNSKVRELWAHEVLFINPWWLYSCWNRKSTFSVVHFMLMHHRSSFLNSSIVKYPW